MNIVSYSLNASPNAIKITNKKANKTAYMIFLEFFLTKSIHSPSLFVIQFKNFFISFVHFYTPNDGKSEGIAEAIKKVDKEFEGMFKLAFLNCKKFKDLCEKQDVREYPTLMVYPPLPAPLMKYEGKVTDKHIVSYLGKFIDNKCIEINNNNFDSFINDHPNLPKIMLFSDKKNTPLIFKKLSILYDKKIEIGIVRKDMTAIISKYKIKSFPKIMAIGVDKKVKYYEGEMKYKPISDFCNIYQETFFVVGEDKTAHDQPKKPWMTEKFPEMNKESGNDICFKVDKAICVVLINNQKPSEKLESVFMEIQNWLSPKINRGAKYKFGWVDSTKQKDFINAVGLEKGISNKLLLINHGRRKRYHVFDGELNFDEIKNIFEKLASGDLRFKGFNENTIPEFNE